MPAPDLDALLAWGRSLGLHDAATKVAQRPWATTARVGRVWLKACGEGGRYEAPLLGALAWWGAPHTVLPLAVDAVRGYVALPDRGVLLRTLGRSLDPWPRLLAEHAELQRRLQRHADDAVGLGVPDLRPARVTDELTALLERAALDDDGRRAVAAVAPALADDTALLAAGPVRPTVQHDDLHDGNVVVDKDGAARALDWGDSSVGRPFGVLHVTLGALERTAGLGSADRERLRDAYLEAWTDLPGVADLRQLARAAEQVQPLARALAWERGLRTADDAERAPWGEPVAGWLAVLAGRPSTAAG